MLILYQEILPSKIRIPEDPVTGSAHCELIPYWSKILNKKNMVAINYLKEEGKSIVLIIMTEYLLEVKLLLFYVVK